MGVNLILGLFVVAILIYGIVCLNKGPNIEKELGMSCVLISFFTNLVLFVIIFGRWV